MGRVDVDGVGIEYEVTGDGAPGACCCTAFPTPAGSGGTRYRPWPGPGFRVIVPDLRGYGRSGKPEAVEAYSLPLLAGDVLAVLADLGIDRAHVVGHDWGAALAWGLAVARARAASTTWSCCRSATRPPSAARPRQREKSWYMLLFQFPGIAERWLSEDDWANFRNWAGHPDADQRDRRPGGERLAHPGPELVPGQRPARVLGRPAADRCRRCRPRPWACGARETSPSPRRR